MRNIGVIVTTKDRSKFLERSLPQIVALGSRVLVIDDGSDPAESHRNAMACAGVRPGTGDVTLLRLPENRGLAGAWNIGLSWFLCDRGIDYISYFQDDVEVDPLLHTVLVALHRGLSGVKDVVLTGHDAREHKPIGSPIQVNGVTAHRRGSCRATQMFAPREAWERVMPIRSKGLGFPKRIEGRGPDEKGEGSDTDWWITRDAGARALKVWCVPGLVRTFAWEARDSMWGNTQDAGEDPPLHRRSIRV